MKNAHFSHDYWHCDNTHCGVHADCVHYLAYLEATILQIAPITVKHGCENKELNYVKVTIEKP